MKFSGECEHYHMKFIDWADRIKIEFHMKDASVTSTLNIFLGVLAKIGLIELRRRETLKWEGCKEATIHRFGTEMWRKNMQTAFDREFSGQVINTAPIKWLCQQRSRREAANPDFGKYRLIPQILSKCPPYISHAVECRLRRGGDFTESTTIFEEVV